MVAYLAFSECPLCDDNGSRAETRLMAAFGQEPDTFTR